MYFVSKRFLDFARPPTLKKHRLDLRDVVLMILNWRATVGAIPPPREAPRAPIAGGGPEPGTDQAGPASAAGSAFPSQDRPPLGAEVEIPSGPPPGQRGRNGLCHRLGDSLHAEDMERDQCQGPFSAPVPGAATAGATTPALGEELAPLLPLLDLQSLLAV